MLSWIFRALRLGGVLTSPQAAPSGLQMTPPSHPGTENPRKPGSPDFIPGEQGIPGFSVPERLGGVICKPEGLTC